MPSQLLYHLSPPQICFTSIKNIFFWGLHIAQEHRWYLVVCSLNGTQTNNARLYWSCLCSSSHYSLLLFPFHSPAYCVSHFQWWSFWNPPVSSLAPFLNFNQHSYYAQCLIHCLLAWMTQGLVIALWMFSIFHLREFTSLI